MPPRRSRRNAPEASPRSTQGESRRTLQRSTSEVRNEEERVAAHQWEVGGALGKPGKEGTVYSAHDFAHGIVAAVKQFKKTKAISTLRKEYGFLERAADAGAAPTPYEVDGAQRRFYMRAMSQTLPEVLASQDGALTGPQQRRILEIYSQLHDAGVYHGDANPLNFMTDDTGKFFVLDFGFAKDIKKLSKKTRWGPSPNLGSLWSLLFNPMQGIVDTGSASQPPLILFQAYVDYRDRHGILDPDADLSLDALVAKYYKLDGTVTYKLDPGQLRDPTPASAAAAAAAVGSTATGEIGKSATAAEPPKPPDDLSALGLASMMAVAAAMTAVGTCATAGWWDPAAVQSLIRSMFGDPE